MSQTTVLLVSAEPSDHAGLQEALAAVRGQPYRLEIVGTLAEALAAIRAGRVEAVVLSLALPDSVGVTTFLRLQPKATSIPIVALVA
jgi:DNA-binding response OmpR family regulator